MSFFTIELCTWRYANEDVERFQHKINIPKFLHKFVSWGFQTCWFLVTGCCNVQNQGVYLSWILFKIRWEIESNSSMKRGLRNVHSEQAECWTELEEVTLSELFGEIHNTRSITWAYSMKKSIINYLKLLGFMKLPVLLGKMNFPFVPGKEFPWNQIISDIELVMIRSIYLTLEKQNKKISQIT